MLQLYVDVTNQQKVVFKTITLDKINDSRYQQHVRKQNIEYYYALSIAQMVVIIASHILMWMSFY